MKIYFIEDELHYHPVILVAKNVWDLYQKINSLLIDNILSCPFKVKSDNEEIYVQ